MSPAFAPVCHQHIPEGFIAGNVVLHCCQAGVHAGIHSLHVHTCTVLGVNVGRLKARRHTCAQTGSSKGFQQECGTSCMPFKRRGRCWSWESLHRAAVLCLMHIATYRGWTCCRQRSGRAIFGCIVVHCDVPYCTIPVRRGPHLHPASAPRGYPGCGCCWTACHQSSP